MKQGKSAKQKNQKKFQPEKENIPIGGRKVIPIKKRKICQMEKENYSNRKKKIFQLEKGEYSNYKFDKILNL